MALIYLPHVSHEGYMQLPPDLYHDYRMQRGDIFVRGRGLNGLDRLGDIDLGEAVDGWTGHHISEIAKVDCRYTYWIKWENLANIEIDLRAPPFDPNVRRRSPLPLNKIHSEPLPLP